jgi:hypothetical protein
MSETLQLYEPINTLKLVDANIWIVDGPIIHMDFPGMKLPFTTRMTIVRLANGDLWVHSPIAMTDALQAEVDKLGPVKHLVSPNRIHYAYIPQWGAIYPDAIKWASPLVRERAESVGIEVAFDQELVDEPDAAWADEIEQLIFRGSRYIEEVVFFHKPSRTLILTDLIENFEPDKVNRRYRALIKMAGTADPDGKAPIDMRMTFWGRKKIARDSAEKIIAWQPERVILAHGRWYTANGTAELKRAFRWLGEF